MKKLLIAALFAVTFMTSAFASETKVNATVLSNFNADFKKASNVNWTMGEEFAKASFVLDNVKMEAYYSRTGEMIGTSKGITLDQLPVRAKRSFAKKYGNYNVIEAIRLEGAEEGAYYICSQNEKETIVVKVSDNDQLSVVKKTKK